MNDKIISALTYLVNEIRNNPDDDIIMIFEEAFIGIGVVAERVDKTPYEIEIRIVES